MSDLIETADAVVAALNSQDFGYELTAKRAYLPLYDIASMKGLHVTVVPRTDESERATRASWHDSVIVDVGIQQKVRTVTNEEIDPLMELAESIKRYLRDARLADKPTVVAFATEYATETRMAVEHLKEHRLFTCVVSVTYRVVG